MNDNLTAESKAVKGSALYEKDQESNSVIKERSLFRAEKRGRSRKSFFRSRCTSFNESKGTISIRRLELLDCRLFFSYFYLYCPSFPSH